MIIGKITIATKGGFERTGPNQWVVNGHPDHIRKAIDGSLKRLKVDQIDLWQLHRVDPRIPLEDTLAPVAEAVKAGKIRQVGLSEVSVKEVEKAQRVLPIVSVQNRYNLGDRQWEEVLDYTTAHQIAFIPWFPLASGPESLKDKTGELQQTIMLPWPRSPWPGCITGRRISLLIPGTHSVEHLRENMKAAELSLSEEEFLALSE